MVVYGDSPLYADSRALCQSERWRRQHELCLCPEWRWKWWDIPSLAPGSGTRRCGSCITLPGNCHAYAYPYTYANRYPDHHPHAHGDASADLDADADHHADAYAYPLSYFAAGYIDAATQSTCHTRSHGYSDTTANTDAGCRLYCCQRAPADPV